jgi:peroxiredoxin
VEILPISVDATPSLKEFKNKLQMKTELLSDFRRDVSRAYGVLNEEKFYSTAPTS